MKWSFDHLHQLFRETTVHTRWRNLSYHLHCVARLPMTRVTLKLPLNSLSLSLLLNSFILLSLVSGACRRDILNNLQSIHGGSERKKRLHFRDCVCVCVRMQSSWRVKSFLCPECTMKVNNFNIHVIGRERCPAASQRGLLDS